MVADVVTKKEREAKVLERGIKLPVRIKDAIKKVVEQAKKDCSKDHKLRDPFIVETLLTCAYLNTSHQTAVDRAGISETTLDKWLGEYRAGNARASIRLFGFTWYSERKQIVKQAAIVLREKLSQGDEKIALRVMQSDNPETFGSNQVNVNTGTIINNQINQQVAQIMNSSPEQIESFIKSTAESLGLKFDNPEQIELSETDYDVE